LLASAGYPNGRGLPKLQLSYISGAGQEEVVQLIQADLKNIGITVDLDGSDGPTFSDKVYGGKFQMARDAWTADYPIADNLGYSNAAVDQGILAARQILDPAARAVAYEKVSATIGNDSPVAPIYAYRHRSVCSARLHNFTYSPLCLSDFVSCWISTQ
jgi:oligopeptide transport system substrate-binding protein